jgi:flagellar biosynthesis anti-sigma factor FlgM
MKINEQINKGINHAVDKPDTSVETQPSSSPIQSPVIVKNDVTTATISTALQSIQSLVSSGPVFDAKKVEALRNEIESGKFVVDTGKVADSLISNSISALTSGKKT